MSDPEPLEALWDWLEEHEKTLRDHPKPPPAESRAKVEASLAQDLDERRTNPLLAAPRWWRIESKGKSGTERFLRLQSLLDKLDHYFSDKKLIRAKVREGELVLGRRWWNLVGRLANSGGKGPLDGPSFAASLRYHHLRRVPLKRREWLAFATPSFAKPQAELKLRLGLCSLSGRARTHFEGTRVLDSERGVFGFRSSSVRVSPPGAGGPRSPDDFYLEELREAVSWSRKQRVHVLVFPELCVCPRGLEVLREEIRSDPGALCLVVPGSYHAPRTFQGEDRRAEQEEWVNSSPIWSVRGGVLTELPSFEKIEPFAMQTADAEGSEVLEHAWRGAAEAGCEYLSEDIRSGVEIRAVVTPLGAFGVAICKDDLVWNEIMDRYRRVIDHLTIVSMTGSPTAWFWSRAQESSRHWGTATFYVNAAQSVAEEDTETDVAFWHLPIHPSRGSTVAPLGRKVRFRRTVRWPPPQGFLLQLVEEHGRSLCEVALPVELCV